MAEQNDGMEIFLARLIERLKSELSVEADDAMALRRAILGLLVAAQDADRRAIKRLAAFLLEEFAPLAGHFNQDRHALLSEFDIMRHRDGEIAELMFPEALLDEIMRAPPSADDLELAGLKWPWEITADRYVGFFDIMGFRAMIEEYADDHQALLDRMDALREAATSAEHLGYDTKAADGPLNFPGCWLRFAQFSDSIVLITRDASAKSSAIIALAAQLMFARALGIGIPIRGAIAKGRMTADFDKSIFFGQPLVDAYLLEGKQAWYGACYHDSANDGGTDPRTGEPFAPADDVPKGWIGLSSEYHVPVKKRLHVKTETGHEALNAVNWAVPFIGNPQALEDALESLRGDGDPKLEAYFEETRRFGLAMLGMIERGE
ncbi:MAG: hypothetical protein QOG13_48 [Sphingomonadales bacterium]|jgi:hypothetical protein|nr:hypothetical protein [Sphingomonadales bacterium]